MWRRSGEAKGKFNVGVQCRSNISAAVAEDYMAFGVWRAEPVCDGAVDELDDNVRDAVLFGEALARLGGGIDQILDTGGAQSILKVAHARVAHVLRKVQVVRPFSGQEPSYRRSCEFDCWRAPTSKVWV